MQHGFALGLNYKQHFLKLYLELLTFQIPINSIMHLNIKSGLEKRHAGKEWNFMGQSKQQTIVVERVKTPRTFCFLNTK